MDSSFLTAFCLVAVAIEGTKGSYKRWVPDTNFNNPSNWNVKRTPCGSDVTIIPEDSPVVYIQLNTTIKELVLPKNGELILGNNLGLGFTDQPAAGCPDTGGDLEFIAIHPEPWLDPSSWCSATTERGNCDITRSLLDVEKVPCTYDDVIFPREHSFFVDISEQVPKLSMKSLKIAGSSFTTSSLAAYFTSPDGQKMFRSTRQGGGGAAVEITRRTCDDVRGCACGNDAPEIEAKICGHVEKTCSRPRCRRTVQPVGACCRMCGAIFNVTRGYGFNFEAFKTSLKTKFFPDGSTNDVNVTMSLTSDGWVQLALNDVTGEKSSALAKRINDEFYQDLEQGGHTYAIDAFQLSLSTGSAIGPPLPPAAHTDKQTLGGGSIAGIVLGILIGLAVIIIIIVFFVFRRQGRAIPFRAPKLPSLPAMPSMPSMPRLPRRKPRATARVPAQPQSAAYVDPGFANPLYDTSPFDDGNSVMKEMELISSSQEQPTFDISEGAGFNNPVYGTHGVSMFSDPSKVETEATYDVAVTSASGSSPVPHRGPTTVIIESHETEQPDSTI